MIFDLNKTKLPNCTNPFYVLIITDTHSHVRKDKLDEFLLELPRPDYIFSLGDVEYRDFEIINNHPILCDIPKYGLLGNHDYFSILNDCSIKSFHGKEIVINGVKITGMYGSIKYKNQNSPMFTDEESCIIASLLPECDIFFTHDKAKLKLEEKLSAHGGMLGIGQYLKRAKPKYHFHGHLHENMNEKIYKTLSIGFARYALLRIDKNGIEIIKQSEFH